MLCHVDDHLVEKLIMKGKLNESEATNTENAIVNRDFG